MCLIGLHNMFHPLPAQAKNKKNVYVHTYRGASWLMYYYLFIEGFWGPTELVCLLNQVIQLFSSL